MDQFRSILTKVLYYRLKVRTDVGKDMAESQTTDTSDLNETIKSAEIDDTTVEGSLESGIDLTLSAACEPTKRKPMRDLDLNGTAKTRTANDVKEPFKSERCDFRRERLVDGKAITFKNVANLKLHRQSGMSMYAHKYHGNSRGPVLIGF
jgi:hypothetical protein